MAALFAFTKKQSSKQAIYNIIFPVISLIICKDDEATFTWSVYTTWDYGIANMEAAHNKVLHQKW